MPEVGIAVTVLVTLALGVRASWVWILRGHAGAVKSYSWPGNIRELQNVVERAVIQ